MRQLSVKTIGFMKNIYEYGSLKWGLTNLAVILGCVNYKAPFFNKFVSTNTKILDYLRFNLALSFLVSNSPVLDTFKETPWIMKHVNKN